MQPQFWHDRWQANEIGFHQSEPHAALARFWPSLGLRHGARVFVPLAGKSPDLLWLAQRGFAVVAIELSPLAVQQFHAENPAAAAAGVNLRCGDFFDLTPQDLGPVDAIFDRASLIALPPDMRRRYAVHLANLEPPGCRTLLITLEYEQSRMPGPPHSVDNAEVQQLYGATHAIDLLARYDQLDDFPRFRARGLERLTEVVYRLTRRPHT
jgi:thiopurine S-methyltransferase